MTSWITFGIVGALLVIMVIGYQHEEIDNLKLSNAGFKSSITEMQAKSKAVETTVAQTTKTADVAITKANENSKIIMNHILSNSDCDAQLQYLRDQAKVINK